MSGKDAEFATELLQSALDGIPTDKAPPIVARLRSNSVSIEVPDSWSSRDVRRVVRDLQEIAKYKRDKEKKDDLRSAI